MRWIPGATSMTAGSYGLAAAGMIAPWPARSLSDLLIVDADVHVHESPGALAPYCDGPWDVALRNVADVPERYLDIPGFSPGGDGTLTARFPTSHEATRMVHTPEQMVAELQAIHIDLAVLFPDHLLKLAVLPAGRLRGRARARLQRLARRPVDLAPRRAARRDRRLPAGSRGRRARDRALRRRPVDRRGLPAVRGPRPALGPPPLRPDLRRRAERRAARCCCTR